MQSQTNPTKPVMDTAGPKISAPLAPPRPAVLAPEPLAPMKAEVSSDLSVAPAPPEGAAGQLPTAKKEGVEAQEGTPAPKPQPKKKPVASSPKLPLALISVTIMVMLLLGTLAVIVYLTTRSS